jgi:A/G-specific adenine glycosylase
VNHRYVSDNADEISSLVTEWGRNNFQQYAWRSTKNRWLALVAEIMLQRTRAAAVTPVWDYWERVFPTPGDLLDSSHRAIEESFKSLGLVWRVEFLRKLAAEIKSANDIPANKADLMELSGIGDYISSAYLSLHGGVREPIVDSNVVRWLTRMIGVEADSETRRAKWIKELANELTPIDEYRDYSYGVLDLTMTICKGRPECAICPVAEFCASRIRLSGV